MRTLVAFVCAVLLLCACKGGGAKKPGGGEAVGDTLPMHYARNLVMIRYADSLVAILRNPWDTTQVLGRYVLVEKNTEVAKQTPRGADAAKWGGPTVVRTPLQKAAVYSSVHAALMQDLGVENAIGGITDVAYVYLPFVQKGVKEGRIADLGNSMEPSLESIMELEPDALMPSPFQNSGGYGRLERIGIPIIECADYMEVSPLARAEWIKFYGRLFGVAEKADSLFAEIERDYLGLKQKVSQVEHRPTLVVESLSGSSWFMPAGKSTMGILYQDAGADYLWRETPESGSLTLSLEYVMERALDAELWLVKYNADKPLTYEEFAKDNAAYRQFRAYKEHRIFGCNTQSTHFYEQTPFHPERLLRDVISVVHPELGTASEKPYYSPLQ